MVLLYPGAVELLVVRLVLFVLDDFVFVREFSGHSTTFAFISFVSFARHHPVGGLTPILPSHLLREILNLGPSPLDHFFLPVLISGGSPSVGCGDGGEDGGGIGDGWI